MSNKSESWRLQEMSFSDSEFMDDTWLRPSKGKMLSVSAPANLEMFTNLYQTPSQGEQNCTIGQRYCFSSPEPISQDIRIEPTVTDSLQVS